MTIKLYNTLTRSKDTFTPLTQSGVTMYNCGPTVYDFAHIGNLRAYVFADALRRMFEYNGFSVKQVINVTDVGHLSGDGDDGEDKMTKALKREGKPLSMESMEEVAATYFRAFKEDLESLNIEMPAEFPHASKHIAEDIELVKKLEEKGFVYVLSDGVYFDTAKFPSYGKLGKIVLSEQKEGERIGAAQEKKSPADFALWKFDVKLGWESPWGRGFPGWHIECSAMARKYLGQPFDIHTGGIDHIPVHHNNEIAQSEAAYDVPLANFWMHNAFVTVNSDKMAKSTGNFITLRTLLDEAISPLAYRYWLLTAHYRSPINFTTEAVQGAQNALIRLMTTIREYSEGGKIIGAYQEKFVGFINDDLDTPKAIALMWDLLKDASQSDADKKATIVDFDRVLGLKLSTVPKLEVEVIPDEIKVLAEAREEARKSKDWSKADALRNEISLRGYTVKDTADGFEVVRD